MAYKTFTIGGSEVSGFRVDADGSLKDFEGTLRNFYSDLGRASAAARRKYEDSTITVTEVSPRKRRYRVDEEALLAIAEEITDTETE